MKLITEKGDTVVIEMDWKDLFAISQAVSAVSLEYEILDEIAMGLSQSQVEDLDNKITQIIKSLRSE